MPRRKGWEPSESAIYLMQSVGITLQMVNAGLGTVTHNAAAALIIGAVIGGYQFYVQRVGNASVPQDTQEAIRLLNDQQPKQ